jgi:hypothetical protein
MSTLIDHIETRSTDRRISINVSTPAERLRNTMAACRVQFTWFGTKKSLAAEQKAQAAETFDAEGQFLSAGKKLIDTKDKSFRAVTAIRTKIRDYWGGVTLPFPEPGVRRKGDITKIAGWKRGQGWKPGRDMFVSSMNLTLGRNPRCEHAASFADERAFHGRPSGRTVCSEPSFFAVSAPSSRRRMVVLARCSPALGLIPSRSKPR